MLACTDDCNGQINQKINANLDNIADPDSDAMWAEFDQLALAVI